MRGNSRPFEVARKIERARKGMQDTDLRFDEAHASGRSEQEVAAALGDPRRLARELRAESGLRRWENHRSLGNSAAALLALGGLAAVDILFLLPLMFAVTLTVLVIGLVIFVLGIVGIGLLLSLNHTYQVRDKSSSCLRLDAIRQSSATRRRHR
jgi:uncharacterized membrane protein